MYDSLDELKKLAGVNEFKGYTEYTLENISDAANSNARTRCVDQITSSPAMHGMV